MVNFIPDVIAESGDEDIQLVQKDIDELASKYIVPIDRIRSIAKIQVTSGSNPDDGFVGLKPSATRKMESRAHAFLRYIGFPVVGGSDFYNPGFPVALGDQGQTRRKNINSKYHSSDFKKQVDLRESDPEALRRIYARKDLASSLYALILRHVRPFQLLDEGLGPLDVDPQSDDIVSRELELLDFEITNPTLNTSAARNVLIETLGTDLTSLTHILRPFVVDPRIVNTVQPDTSIIAVPFLPNKQALKIDEFESAQRPGLELIIRERLRDRKSTSEDQEYFANIAAILKSDGSPNANPDGLDENTLKLTVSALLDDNEISEGAIKDLQGITDIQIVVISQLVKTIKALTKVLHESILVIEQAKEDINWIPLMNEEGPEMGTRGAQLALSGASIGSTLGRQIKDLELRKAEARRRITAEQDLGNFASPFDVNMNDDDLEIINEQLRDLTSRRDSLANDAFKALGNIELISGEVSGLGLMDILAIYAALWSMDEQGLVSLLDNESFERMSDFFSDLIVGAAESREISGTKDDIITALGKFEKRLINILSFADKEFASKLVVEGFIEGGSISVDS